MNDSPYVTFWATVNFCPHGPVCFSQPNFMVSRLGIDASERIQGY